jgi:hypothetical protein
MHSILHGEFLINKLFHIAHALQHLVWWFIGLTQLTAGVVGQMTLPFPTAAVRSASLPRPMASNEGHYKKLCGATHFLGLLTLLVPSMMFTCTIMSLSFSGSSGEGNNNKKDEPNSSEEKRVVLRI